MIVAAVSILVIIGGVATGAVLLHQRHTQQSAAPPPATTSPAPSPTTDVPLSTTAPDAGLPNGSTALRLATGACVSAQATADNQYRLGRQVTCGTAQSDLVLAVLSPDMTGCADHEYPSGVPPSAFDDDIMYW